mmetsp:Transcript_33595/g.51701  ORF Transcript_33595/g.51701 Transcript_33595/m.51701 type:complete len:315 (-) Transcript_33595:474-1418(-)
MESSGVESSNFLVNMAIYIAALVFFVLAMGLFFVLKHIQKIKKKVETIIKGILKKTFWCNTIRSITISYLETAISLLVSYQAIPVKNLTTLTPVLPLFAYIIAYPTICLVALIINRKSLDTKEMQERIGKMYVGISLTREQLGFLFYPIFIYRRMFFVLIPLFLQGREYLQLQCLILMSSLYILFYGQFKPHIHPRTAKMEIINEFCFLLLDYHLMTFTLFNIVVDTKFVMGYSYLAFLALLIGINFANLILNTIEKYQRKKMLKQLKIAVDAQWDNLFILEEWKMKYKGGAPNPEVAALQKKFKQEKIRDIKL